jgi:hypothetical protein
LGIGIDVPHPMAASLGFMSPPLLLADQPRPKTPSGWLFHFNCRNVLALRWEPLFSEDAADFSENKSGRCDGFRVWLVETDGRDTRLGLRCFRAPTSAKVICEGNDAWWAEPTIDGDRVDISLNPHQSVEVEVRFHNA